MYIDSEPKLEELLDREVGVVHRLLPCLDIGLDFSVGVLDLLLAALDKFRTANDFIHYFTIIFLKPWGCYCSLHASKIMRIISHNIMSINYYEEL